MLEDEEPGATPEGMRDLALEYIFMAPVELVAAHGHAASS